MRILDSLGVGKSVLNAILGFIFAALTAACAPVPIQEMSDARQAISVAREAVGGVPDLRKVERAQMLLEQAERELREGEYGVARRIAIEAKTLAIQAREEGAIGNVSQ